MAIYQALFVFYSYPNDDTETATFDLTVALHVWLNDAVVRGSAIGGERIQVGVDGWLKHSFSNTRKRMLRQL